MTPPPLAGRSGRNLLETVAAFLGRGSGRLTVEGIVQPARPYVIARLRRAVDSPLLVVTPTAPEAERVWEELRFYLPPPAPVFHFPAWEVLPFEPLSPAAEISAARIATLAALPGARNPAVVAPLESALQFLVPRGKLSSVSIHLETGRPVAWSSLRRRLLELGYEPVEKVEVRGEFSRRGGIIDIFPSTLPGPVRVELVGDDVDSIRLFEPDTQRSGEQVGQVTVLPSREIILDGQTLGALGTHLPPAPEGEERDLLAEASRIPGLEHYQALLSRSRSTILDHFPEPPLVVACEHTDLETRWEGFRKEVRQERGRALLPSLFDPAGAYLEFPRWMRLLRDLPVLFLDAFGLPPEGSESLRTETASGRSVVMAGRGGTAGESPLQATVRQLRQTQSSECVTLVGGSEETARRLLELCSENGLGTVFTEPAEAVRRLESPRPGTPVITWGLRGEGFRYADEKVLVITEEDLFGAKHRRPPPRAPKKSSFALDFRLLKTGDYLVHAEHGIGIYQGLSRMEAGGKESEYLVIAYEGGDRVYVPVNSLDAVQRYLALEGSRPRIDKLGGKVWAAAKKKAKKDLLTLARDLLRLYAVRHSTPGHAFPPDTPWQSEFEMAFEYTETPDQRRATDEIKADMEGPHPMDRLVCGDVGYGKTEVAMRAAFKAVMDSRQVAVLAPTTILVQQHFTTFRERFAAYPVRVEMLSRFVKPSRQKQIAADAAEGRVDILIGTHRLLGKDVNFRDLGLVIVDEEQRFGVRHKESLKRFRETVDVLALTATPIPRSLYLSVSGIRELSQISTPPEDRLAVSNTVTRFDSELIREAVLRELRRGGQVFFIHNRVRSIPGMAALLQKILPEVRIGIAHGQMGEKELERVMARFRGGEYDLLLSTTIVESGLDIPNANTMFINRADMFGLSELYQLRGRIGRSRHRAYAYFLVPMEGGLSGAARRRIEVIRDFAHLGAGFQIALYDLEIRGAGSVLGYRQSGHIAAIGFELYTKLLRETLQELQGEPVREERPSKVSLPLPCLLPEQFIPEEQERLLIYKRIADTADAVELEDLARELRERFGPLPPPVRHLLWASALRCEGEKAGAKTVDWKTDSLEIAFYPGAEVRGEAVLAVLQGAPAGSRMTGGHSLLWRWGTGDGEGRYGEALGLLRGLQ